MVAVMPTDNLSRLLGLVVLPAILGGVTGLCVSGLVWLFEEHALNSLVTSTSPWTVLITLAALPLSVLVMRFVAGTLSPSTNELYILRANDANKSMPLREIPGRLLAGAVTVGCGGAQGQESPSASLGAGLGNGNGRCRSLEGGQERVDVDVGQFRGLVGLVRRADGAVRVGGIQIKDQILHVRWRPRCRCLPQAAVSQNLFDDLAPTIAPLWCPRFDERYDLHRAAALRTRQWVYFITPLDQHRPCLATARRCHRRSAVLQLVHVIQGGQDLLRPARSPGRTGRNARLDINVDTQIEEFPRHAAREHAGKVRPDPNSLRNAE